MKHRIQIIGVLLVAALAASAVVRAITIDGGCYAWPAVTHCRACGGTIWCWERYERRIYAVRAEIENETKYALPDPRVGGLVHADCATPECRLSIVVTTTDRGATVEFRDGFTLFPLEELAMGEPE